MYRLATLPLALAEMVEEDSKEALSAALSLGHSAGQAVRVQTST